MTKLGRPKDSPNRSPRELRAEAKRLADMAKLKERVARLEKEVKKKKDK
jgi:hypothetical protein